MTKVITLKATAAIAMIATGAAVPVRGGLDDAR
jgi:hypothetical protein